MSSVFKFLTRPGCHLCDEARPLVERAVRRRGGIIEEVDIDADDPLSRDYGLRIPVLLGPDEVVIAEGRIESDSLRRALRGWRDHD
ncbi:MAG: glutaredoxin family protein [Acidimicrobiia bacterium]